MSETFSSQVLITGPLTVESVSTAMQHAMLRWSLKTPVSVGVSHQDLDNLPSEINGLPVKARYTISGTIQVEFSL